MLFSFYIDKRYTMIKLRKMLLLGVLGCYLAAGAQDFIVPQTNINTKGYPHVLPDNIARPGVSV